MDPLDYGALCVCLIEIIYVFGPVFLYCEIGNRLSSEFETIEDSFYNLNWNAFPDEFRRMMPIILLVTQQPVELSSYGNFTCERATFQAVI